MLARRLLQVNLVTSIVIAILFIAFPERAAALMGLATGPATRVIVQYFGATHVAFAVLIWLALRSREQYLLHMLVISFFAGDTIGTAVLLIAQLQGLLGASGWWLVVGSLFFALSYGYLTISRRWETP